MEFVRVTSTPVVIATTPDERGILDVGSLPYAVGGLVIAHSSAGKTFLVTAFARYFANQGLRVALFKGQNMSNNARVVAGGEIGVAQYIQALAARQVPDVRMNPVLIKPQRRGSHVMMLGQYDPELSGLPWRLRKPPSRTRTCQISTSSIRLPPQARLSLPGSAGGTRCHL